MSEPCGVHSQTAIKGLPQTSRVRFVDGGILGSRLVELLANLDKADRNGDAIVEVVAAPILLSRFRRLDGRINDWLLSRSTAPATGRFSGLINK